MLRRILLLCLLVLPVAAMAQEASIIGTIGGERVTTLDAERHLAQTGGQRPGETREQAVERAGNELLASHVVDRLMGQGSRLNPGVRRALDQQRRQTLLDFHLRMNLEITPPTDAEIDAFIAENAQLFSERRSYWFAQILLPTPEAEGRSAVDAALEELRAGPVTPERVLRFQQRLMEAEVLHERRTRWNPSEELSPGFRAALDALEEAGEGIALVEQEGGLEIRLLFGRFDDPADPALQRRQVAQLLVQREVAQQRDGLIAELAMRARDAPGEVGSDETEPAPVPVVDDAPPVLEPRAGAPWMFAAVGGIGLLLPMAFWTGRRFGQAVALSGWYWPVRLGTGVILLGALGGAVWVGYRLYPVLGPQTLAALAAGGLVMGALIAGTWARRLLIYDPAPFPDGLRYLATLALLFGLFGLYLAGRQGLV